MKYRFLLRIKMPDNKWLVMGDDHTIQWDIRDLITASSGWMIMNEESMGLASSIIPKLQKGIFELKYSKDDYISYEISHGLGTIKNVLHFYEDLLHDCQQYPYTELYGQVKS